MTNITKDYRKKKIITFIISLVLWFGLCGFLVIYGLCNAFQVNAESETAAKPLLDLFVPLIVSYIVALILVIFIREKLRNSIWLANIILGAALFGNTFMYVVIGLFALDEFIINPLYKHYKLKESINKEIDKR